MHVENVFNMIGTLINKNLQWPKPTRLLECQCINLFQYCASHTIHLDANKDALLCWCWTRWTLMSAGTIALNRSWDSNLIVLGFFFGFTLASDMVLNIWRGFRLFLWSRWCGIRLFACHIIIIGVSSFCIRIFRAGRVLVLQQCFSFFCMLQVSCQKSGYRYILGIPIIDLGLDWNKTAFDKCRGPLEHLHLPWQQPVVPFSLRSWRCACPQPPWENEASSPYKSSWLVDIDRSRNSTWNQNKSQHFSAIQHDDLIRG